MWRVFHLVAVLLMIALSPATLAQKSTGHMDLEDVNGAPGPHHAVARVAISKTDAVCPQQIGVIRIGNRWGVRDTVVALPGGPGWTIESSAADADDFSFRRRLATDSCRIDIDVSEQRRRNGEWVPLSKQSSEQPNDNRMPKINDDTTTALAKRAFNPYDRARADAGGLQQGLLGILPSGLWKGEIQDCFEAVGTYLIDRGGVTLLFPTDLGEELNRFSMERVDVDADHSTLYLSRGACRVGFTISAATWREGLWVPQPIEPLGQSKQGTEKN
jgi:hypothetical protein